MPNHHEMYAQYPQSPQAQEMYTQANQSGGGYQTQRQQQGNWIAAQVPADQYQYHQFNQQQQQPVQLEAGGDGVRRGNGGQGQVYEKP